jgi:hypothetical protein
MLALADDAALARLVIAATRIRTYRRGQWLRRPPRNSRLLVPSCAAFHAADYASSRNAIPMRP